ncbi:hypothetical protein FO519_010142, partial [Halicephalobus sp. NKZ332]
EDLMSALIVNRGFQKIWQDETVEFLNSQDEEKSEKLIRCESAPLTTDSASGALVVDDLSHQVHLAVETFLRSLPLALPHSDAKLSRETASLYSVRVQLDRLTINTAIELPQLRLAARRVGHLLKNFTICISSPFPVGSCSFLASSLCDLLYRFEELCSFNEDLVPLISCTKLRKSIDDFHYNIVKRLNSILLQRRPTTGTTTSGLGTSYYSLSNLSSGNFHSSRAPVSMGPTVIFQKHPPKHLPQKGFLLPPDLEEARNRLRRSKSMSIRNLHVHQSSKKIAVDEIENRSKNPKPTDEIQTLSALKAACKLTRDVVDEISKRVDRL